VISIHYFEITHDIKSNTIQQGLLFLSLLGTQLVPPLASNQTEQLTSMWT